MNVERSGRRSDGGDPIRVRGDRGAVMVEMAIMAPILFLVLFAVIEFGWAFSQHLDSRHGAREGVRLAAVNYNPFSQTGTAQHATILATACQRMDPAGVTKIRLTLVTPGANQVGDRARLEVSVDVETLSGMLDPILDDMVLTSTVVTRLERDASWTGSTSWTTCV